jgi:hypothetical protein
VSNSTEHPQHNDEQFLAVMPFFVRACVGHLA